MLIESEKNPENIVWHDVEKRASPGETGMETFIS